MLGSLAVSADLRLNHNDILVVFLLVYALCCDISQRVVLFLMDVLAHVFQEVL